MQATCCTKPLPKWLAVTAHLITVQIVDQLLFDKGRTEEVAKRALAINPEWESMFEQYIKSIIL